MKTLISALVFLALTPAAYAADMPMDGMQGAHKNMGNMPMEQQKAAQTATATGTVKKVDQDKGSITIAHDPVPQLQWPAMVMPFKASAEQMNSVKVGDEVEFSFTSSGMKAELETITRR